MMLRRKLISIVFVLSLAAVLKAQSYSSRDSVFFLKNYTSKTEIGVDYLVPTRFSNKIKTINFNCLFWKKYCKNISTLISVGITGTYAWGRSLQTYPLGDTAIEYVSYKTSAFGLGPVVQVDPTLVKIKRFSIIAEASGGVMLYNNHFPHGGDMYNFMFRTGPSVTYQLSKHAVLKAGYRWMHVSNGQGYGNQNPFYEAQGFSISFIKTM
ncbi:MAG TPA: acyloxyacyl hydrolase [Bacteroidia bacterium]|jgi:lipid A 3-O-deacylase|nr:acyloxyacyl hydrolase [Bacteroidia bacterium]